jgi:hypothetical protein
MAQLGGVAVEQCTRGPAQPDGGVPQDRASRRCGQCVALRWAVTEERVDEATLLRAPLELELPQPCISIVRASEVELRVPVCAGVLYGALGDRVVWAQRPC